MNGGRPADRITRGGGVEAQGAGSVTITAAHGLATQGRARRGNAWLGAVSQGRSGLGLTWHDETRDLPRFSLGARLGAAWRDDARRGTFMRRGSEWHW